MKVQDLIHKENIHQSSPCSKPGIEYPIPGPSKANMVQSMEGNIQITTALVQLAQKRVVPFTRTRFNIIPNQSQE
eukprot:12936464-Prorocentrum_lima.AAC.1